MWIISWRFNGKSYVERYDIFEEASERLDQLACVRASLHFEPKKRSRYESIH